MVDVQLSVVEIPDAADLAWLDRERVAFDAAQVGAPDDVGFAVLLRAASGTLVGGLDAALRFDWLFIKTLYLAPDRRREGWGSLMLARAEEIGRARGAVGAWLTTLSAEAVAFYERRGYARFGALERYAAGRAVVFLSKDLGGAGRDRPQPK